MDDEDESLTSEVRSTHLSDSLFEELYRRERLGLVRLVLLVVGSRAAAEDVVQESFLRLQATSTEVADPVRYLRKIALNEARQVLGVGKSKDDTLLLIRVSRYRRNTTRCGGCWLCCLKSGVWPWCSATTRTFRSPRLLVSWVVGRALPGHLYIVD